MNALSLVEEKIVLACSVRHKFGAAWPARSSGSDVLHLPIVQKDLRAELIVDGDVWSATGARLEHDANPFIVSWWFSGHHVVNYALVIYGAYEPLDVDRFIEINSVDGVSRELDFGAWKFCSSWY